MWQLFPLQMMNSNIFKLSHLFLNGPGSCDLHSIKREMKDIDQMATIRMGKLEWFDFDNKKAHAAAIATLVSNQNEPTLQIHRRCQLIL